jgi:hypothetical protein
VDDCVPRVPTYIALTWALAVAVISLGFTLPAGAIEWSPWGAGALLVFATLSERLAVWVPNRETDEAYVVSVATIPHMMCALLLPPPLAAAIAGLAMLTDEVLGRRPADRALFNTASTAVGVGLTAIAASQLGLSGQALETGGWLTVVGVLLVAGLY